MECLVRRATIEDLPVLQALWQRALLPGYALEKRLTEFYVIVRGDGVISGSIGVRREGWHGLFHSEVYASPREANACRQAFWDGLQKILRGQGIIRFWMREPVDEFWQQVGFSPATPQELQRLPRTFQEGRGRWYTYALTDEAAAEEALRKGLALIHAQEEKERTRWERWARFWKAIAVLIALGFLGAAIWLLLHLPIRR